MQRGVLAKTAEGVSRRARIGSSRKVRRGSFSQSAQREFLAELAEGVLAKCAEGSFSQSAQRGISRKVRRVKITQRRLPSKFLSEFYFANSACISLCGLCVNCLLRKFLLQYNLPNHYHSSIHIIDTHVVHPGGAPCVDVDSCLLRVDCT